MALRNSQDQQDSAGLAGAHYGGGSAGQGGQAGWSDGYGSYGSYGEDALFSQQPGTDGYAAGQGYDGRQADPYAYEGYPQTQQIPQSGTYGGYAGGQGYVGQHGAAGVQHMRNVGYRGGRHGQPPEPPRKKKGNAGLVIAVILLVVGLALLVGAGVLYFQSQQAYSANEQEYTELAEANVTEDTDTGTPIVDFEALQLLNSEIVGWIQIPDTVINYPVVQHSDNSYYLNHSFLGRYDEFGAVFMDYRSASDLSDWNTVFYGHHLQNGNMFAKIADYSDQTEFDTLQNLYYVTSDGTVRVLVPLCCIVVNGYDVDSIQFDFTDQASFETYVQSLIDRSSARSSTATASGVSHIYMFSTCSYEQDNDRTILVCVDLTGSNGTVVDASQSLSDIQAAADEVIGTTDETQVEG